MEIGKYNQVKVIEQNKDGYLLADAEGNQVLLPSTESHEPLEVEQELTVFIYTDKDDQSIATLQTPKAELGEVAYMQVVSNAPFGAFLDWGIPKDILVPLREQAVEMVEDGWYLVIVFKDRIDGRLTASSRIENYLSEDTQGLEQGQAVELTIWNETDLGVNVIVDNQFQGLLYHNEIFSDLHMGDKTRGFIKKVREDGKLDITLQREAHLNIEPDAEMILQRLEDEGGYLPLNDKADPKLVYDLLEISKKSFKRALGSLYKRRLIKFEDNGIRFDGKTPLYGEENVETKD